MSCGYQNWMGPKRLETRHIELQHIKISDPLELCSNKLRKNKTGQIWCIWGQNHECNVFTLFGYDKYECVYCYGNCWTIVGNCWIIIEDVAAGTIHGEADMIRYAAEISAETLPRLMKLCKLMLWMMTVCFIIIC